MVYPWYEEIIQSVKITQGDIIFKCPIPVPNEKLFDAILSSTESLEAPLDIKEVDIIILSQACDIEQNKIDSIAVCPLWPLTTLKDKSGYYKSSKARESLRQGKEPSYHLLNKHFSNNITFPYAVIDFHRIYSLPKDYLNAITRSIAFRLRLLPPYREHLSQAFARYFMRVGLPVDISTDDIKNI